MTGGVVGLVVELDGPVVTVESVVFVVTGVVTGPDVVSVPDVAQAVTTRAKTTRREKRRTTVGQIIGRQQLDLMMRSALPSLSLMPVSHRSALLVLFVTTLVLVLNSCASEPMASDALSAEIDGGGQVVGFLHFDNGSDKSFGLFVCATEDGVTLDSIESISARGEIELIGGLVYEAADDFVGAVDGFPPSGIATDTFTTLEDGVVSTKCGDEATETRTQVVVGAERTGPGGGMIEGLRIYHDDGFLDIGGFTIVLCGDQYEYCEDYAPGA